MLVPVPDCCKEKSRTIHDEFDGFEVVTYSIPHKGIKGRCFLEKSGYVVASCNSVKYISCGLDTFTNLYGSAKVWAEKVAIRERRNARCIKQDIADLQTDLDRITEIFGGVA